LVAHLLRSQNANLLVNDRLCGVQVLIQYLFLDYLVALFVALQQKLAYLWWYICNRLALSNLDENVYE